MRKIQVLTRKEEIDPSKLTHCTAVVIDVLLATSTIAAALHHGIKEVFPVINGEEALAVYESFGHECIVAGELAGYPLEGFINPDPLELIQADFAGKSLILSTTNGTVAIKKASTAKRVYTSSIVNGAEVAKQIRNDPDDSSLVIICAGSMGNFSIEDFLGAGYLISELVKADLENWTLSDSARTAYLFYQSQNDNILPSFQKSATASLLKELGYSKAICYAAQPGILPVVPRLVDSRLIVD
ncbi:2-phosphosulfolactate phosphatase [Ammoniphilus resinae]|uniref:Probable 2-phosphosulfolactate phosphatase n=1 Tax=Ammoniphilus resinae TaxID=861532 RepID=A0ABS4GLH9_9BACL|nr:2-phosphosulfolactate phosphatase [Ammoniphilus resinae]MBP1931130.1 2-phosphosulfolactate phosphatase [Ammoniphilus resinae]